MWSTGINVDLFEHLIESMIVIEDVNPNKVYIVGYSAGGDGVYALGTRMADRWAGCLMGDRSSWYFYCHFFTKYTICNLYG